MGLLPPFRNSQKRRNPFKVRWRFDFKFTVNLTGVGTCLGVSLTKGIGSSYPIGCWQVVIIQQTYPLTPSFLYRSDSGKSRSLSRFQTILQSPGLRPSRLILRNYSCCSILTIIINHDDFPVEVSDTHLRSQSLQNLR